ncbi:uncharacterized protein LOC110036021 [Phalaenopsis equestris]|uniref:uncharacterized protein LOC110035710 n=1 Tax=Phalaenopsis equestris TaxID=78828 RepID=UPI0009E518C3|nr:uncharacterized protein LOC110035710 [Phalaenopsis equestris]XP_020596025.1 uncharacterized protein LOC110036021 [Phalaenopsis equestris]XP_020596026.1 uncharacterized protein LOC110036021 [Phalaenopsis equestris]XP_020596027.1 uncharacterized protein LOC110036021 [Phalaenopsis equestris]
MKLWIASRKVYDYIRYDLKEIAFPSSLPDPPHIKKRRKLTLVERWLILKEASRLYAASWVRDIGPDLRPNDYKNKQNDNVDQGRNANSKNDEPSTLEDLAVAARGGMETLKPALQRLYMIRASAYRDALKCFIQGYQEGINSVMDKSKDTNLKMQDGVPRKDS